MAAPRPIKSEKPEAQPLQPAPAPKQKSRKLLVIVAGATTLILASAGAAAWFVFKPKSAAEAATAPAAAKPKSDKKQIIFVPLDTFTVNLQPEAGDRYLQTTLSLKVTDAATEQAIKQQMPEIRSKLLLLLSSKRGSELISVEGKQALANQIAEQVNRALNPDAPQAGKAPEAPAAAEAPAAEGPVLSVLFTNFIIQ